MLSNDLAPLTSCACGGEMWRWWTSVQSTGDISRSTDFQIIRVILSLKQLPSVARNNKSWHRRDCHLLDLSSRYETHAEAAWGGPTFRLRDNVSHLLYDKLTSLRRIRVLSPPPLPPLPTNCLHSPTQSTENKFIDLKTSRRFITKTLKR